MWLICIWTTPTSYLLHLNIPRWMRYCTVGHAPTFLTFRANSASSSQESLLHQTCIPIHIIYTTLWIPRSVHRDYFHIPTDAITTALVHSDGLFTLEDVETRTGFDLNEVFVVHVGSNAYPSSHRWHDAAEEWNNLPLLRYSGFMQTAKCVTVSDSYLFHLTALTNPPTP